MGLWKVEVRDMKTDKTKSTCLAFIDVPDYNEAMLIRDNLDVEWTYNGKIDAMRYETCIYPSTKGAPEMWFYWKPKLGEKTPMISRLDHSLEECLMYRNPMTRGMVSAGSPNHGFYTINPRLRKGGSPLSSHPDQDELTRPFGDTNITASNKGGRASAPMRDGDLDMKSPMHLTADALHNTIEEHQKLDRRSDRGSTDFEHRLESLKNNPEMKEMHAFQEAKKRSSRVYNRVTPRGRMQKIEDSLISRENSD